jgi:hypothetical protein
MRPSLLRGMSKQSSLLVKGPQHHRLGLGNAGNVLMKLNGIERIRRQALVEHLDPYQS